MIVLLVLSSEFMPVPEALNSPEAPGIIRRLFVPHNNAV
jgi:hypothetical protein